MQMDREEKTMLRGFFAHKLVGVTGGWGFPAAGWAGLQLIGTPTLIRGWRERGGR